MDEFIPPPTFVFSMTLIPRYLMYMLYLSSKVISLLCDSAMAMCAPPAPMGIGNYGELWEIELWLCAPRPHPWESGIMGNLAMAMGAPPEPMGIGNYGELWGIELWLWAPRPHPWESGIMGNPGVPPPSTIYKNSQNIERTLF